MLWKTMPMVGLCLALGAPLFGQTKEEAEGLVKKAVTFAKANGAYKLVQAINKQDPEFRKGELYLWMVDIEEKRMAAHGDNPKLVGADFSGVKDVDGVAYAQQAVEIGVEKGSGWVTYKFKHPETHQVASKTCYVEKFRIFVIACGVYAK